MIIDAHQHFWKYDPVRDSWIDESMQTIRRDFMPEDLAPTLAQNDVDSCIAVQADQSENETLFLLELADHHEFIRGVVGWIDLKGEQLDEQLKFYSQYQKLVGFRHVVQGEADHNFMLRPAFQKGIAALKEHHFTYDILIFPHQMGAALELVNNFPDQKFIIDHLAKPYIKDGFFKGWSIMMRELAKSKNVFCKVSGMVTEADWSDWKQEDFVPYLDCVLEHFGFDRLIYGSDWPVCLLGGSYKSVKGILETYLAPFSEEDKQKIWYKNAISFYNLKR